MDSDKRRSLFEAIVEKHKKLGDKFEDDPSFLASVEEWILGNIEIDDLRSRYRSLSKIRLNAKALARSRGI